MEVIYRFEVNGALEGEDVLEYLREEFDVDKVRQYHDHGVGEVRKHRVRF